MALPEQKKYSWIKGQPATGLFLYWLFTQIALWFTEERLRLSSKTCDMGIPTLVALVFVFLNLLQNRKNWNFFTVLVLLFASWFALAVSSAIALLLLSCLGIGWYPQYINRGMTILGAVPILIFAMWNSNHCVQIQQEPNDHNNKLTTNGE